MRSTEEAALGPKARVEKLPMARPDDPLAGLSFIGPLGFAHHAPSILGATSGVAKNGFVTLLGVS